MALPLLGLALGIILGRASAPVHLAAAPSWSRSKDGDSLIYNSADVTPGKPSPVGKGSFRFEDARGAYERREFPLGAADSGKHLYVNILFTKAGLVPFSAQHELAQLEHRDTCCKSKSCQALGGGGALSERRHPPVPPGERGGGGAGAADAGAAGREGGGHGAHRGGPGRASKP